MVFKWFRLISLLLISGLLYFVCQIGIPYLETPIPAVGKFLNPFTGFLKNNNNSNEIQNITSSFIEEEVEILWDERDVPHIFAKNNSDLYFAQGYLHAQHRLFQMDFTARVSGGTLSEVIGPKAANFDQFNKRIGLSYAAKLSIDSLTNSPHQEEYSALKAYADGVNAYIEQLKPANYPVEFKLLNYKPEKWSPYKSALILKYMAWDLDGNTKDKYISSAKDALPEEVFKSAFPIERPYNKPVIPERRRRRSVNSRYNINPPGRLYNNQYIFGSTYQKGSNNWVVNGSKSRSGKPILANDPHLGLNLPSTWYENQLVSPDCNVYGVSIPGLPMVVIGFTPDVAWGLTYTASDRIDFTPLELNEKNQYKLDGIWENPLIISDTIAIKGSDNIINETLFTQFGPIVYTEDIPDESYNHMIPDKNMAMSWTALAPTLEFVSIYKLNRAKNLSDYQEALKYYSAPGQNFAFATKNNDIAIWHNGRFPIRAENEARFIHNQAKKEYIWDDFIPFDELPHSINPREGYLFSANQKPVGANYKYYLGSDTYSDFERANRIAEVLDSLTNIVPEDFKKLQLDKKGMLASKLLPYLLDKLPLDNLTDNEKDIYEEISNWDYQFTSKAKAPVFYYRWLDKLQYNIWKDEAKEEYKDNTWWLPFYDRTAQLILTDSLSQFFDNKLTPEIEDQRSIIESSFKDAATSLIEKHGSLNESWQWNRVNPTEIKSIAQLKGFGVTTPLPTGGSSDAVNAISGNHGPSWRMIVELRENGPVAFGVYPGGQDGNPGAESYESFVNDWAKGSYYPLHLIQDPDKVEIPITKTIIKNNK